MPSHYFLIYCAKCEALITKYKKEGSGSLIRVYLERMDLPEVIPKTFKISLKNKTKNLICYNCGQLLGKLSPTSIPKAYKLVKGAFVKRKNS